MPKRGGCGEGVRSGFPFARMHVMVKLTLQYTLSLF
jgi:hypothetical protein